MATKENSIKVYAAQSNGDLHQCEVIGDTTKILAYIGAYQGNDLGNDLICQDFVEDMPETGVIIFANQL